MPRTRSATLQVFAAVHFDEAGRPTHVTVDLPAWEFVTGVLLDGVDAAYEAGRPVSELEATRTVDDDGAYYDIANGAAWPDALVATVGRAIPADAARLPISWSGLAEVPVQVVDDATGEVVGEGHFLGVEGVGVDLQLAVDVGNPNPGLWLSATHSLRPWT